MKTYYIVAIIFFCSAFAKAQDSTTVEVPKIYLKAFQGQSTIIEGTSLRLVNVIEDSRCPQGVDCIWAGNAKVVVELTSESGKKTTKEIILNGGRVAPIYSEDGLVISIKGLAPYPTSLSKIKASDYYLRVEVSN
ncbi:hypothetical protein JM84_0256 [Dokdonia sp. Hel_I_63]|jgi:hypothetical protein|uniref:hypothetical protein n=1 Tax=unclassified Dokdonia TaxID=2615033 RepID=UPI00020A7C4E|nr:MULTISPECIES: hypothetical protein [unclassified Dokdonia]AEE19381.1 hypothetical protein Krodi_1398 [Dokdonia sp. 4H-3-7-5]TVZ21385.1 hypothetical protein JM84_0256 [Dokdonia sp. Hel_I_63]